MALFFKKKNTNKQINDEIDNQQYEKEELLIIGPKPLSDLNEADRYVVDKYLNKLDCAIKHKYVYNIALSGRYCSGKSSIIKTYIEEKNSTIMARIKSFFKINYNEYITISIGSFLKYDVSANGSSHDNKINIKSEGDNNTFTVDTSTNNEDNTISKDEKDKDKTIDLDELKVVDKIEESFLKQIIYRDYSENMPDSNIKRIHKRVSKSSAILSLFMVIIIISFILTNEYVYTFISNIYDYLSFFTTNIIIQIILLIFMLLILIIGTYSIIRKTFFSTSVKNIKIEKGSLEVDLIDNLPFNKKLHEILYFFSKNRVKAVFLEDIDRFSNDIALMVMEELKELNTIINNSKAMNGITKNKVCFVYAFKDDIFNDYTKRSKFYDYIVSIMPLSTRSNSTYLLGGMLKDNAITLDLIKIISDYVTDYRTLVCIVNDYNTFSRILNIKEEYEKNSLLATMAFKNTAISTYNKLGEEENDIDITIREVKDNLYATMEEYQGYINYIKEIENANSKTINTTLEFIDFLYEKVLLKDEDGLILYKDESEPITKEQLCNLLILKKVNLADFKISSNELYLPSKSIIDNIGDYRFSKVKRELTNNLKILGNRKTRLKGELYYKLYPKNTKGNNEDQLIEELIISGFLNENYLDYITQPVINEEFGYEENQYMNRINHGYIAEMIELKHPDTILRYIKEDKYYNLRNYSLIKYMQEKEKENENQLLYDDICHEFDEIDDEKIDFLVRMRENIGFHGEIEFYKRLINCTAFIDNLANYCKDEISKNVSIVISNILKVSLKKYEFNKELFITTIENIKEFDWPWLNKEIMETNFIDLGIRFNDVTSINDDYIISDYEFIKKNRLYKFTLNNINAMNLNFKDINSEFVKYVLDKPELFAKELYLDNKEYIIDNEEVVLELLKNGKIPNEFRKALIVRETFKSSEVDKIFPLTFVSSNHLLPTWTNLVKAYEDTYAVKSSSELEKTNETFVDYMLDNEEQLFKKKNSIKAINKDSFNNLLIKKLIEKNLIEELDMYLEVTSSRPKFNIIKGYSNSVINFMLANDLIEYSKTNINKINSNPHIAPINKAKYAYRLYKNKTPKTIIKNIKMDKLSIIELVKIPKAFDENLEILYKLDLDKETLRDLYSLLFEDNRSYLILNRIYKKIIEVNLDLFDVSRSSKDNGRVNVKLKSSKIE